MRNSVARLVQSLRERGVALEVKNGKLRCRGKITDDERAAIVRDAPIIESLLMPDETLPDVLTIPAGVPNTVAAITDCINSQRIKKAA
jgi:TubC N-terminal docking domain